MLTSADLFKFVPHVSKLMPEQDSRKNLALTKLEHKSRILLRVELLRGIDLSSLNVINTVAISLNSSTAKI